jgi:hypothetical protein
MKYKRKGFVDATQWFPPYDPRHVPIPHVDPRDPAIDPYGDGVDHYYMFGTGGQVAIPVGGWVIVDETGKWTVSANDYFVSHYEKVENE